MVVDDDDDELHRLLHGGDELLREHEVRPVADEHEDVALRRGHAHAESPRDLVAHRRVAVLDVVTLRVTRSPELVQVAGHRAGGADDYVLGRRDGIHAADDLALRRKGRGRERVQTLDLAVPVLREPLRLGPVGIRDAVRGGRERRDRRARVADEREAGVLVRVELRDVHVDEAHVARLERGLRHGREVAPACPYPDDEVGLLRERVRGAVPGDTDRTDASRVVVREGAFAGLRLGDGDAARLRPHRERDRRARVDDAAARDDERPLRAGDERPRALERRAIRQATLDVPHPLREEVLGHVERLGLHVLRQRQRHGSGVRRAHQDAHGRERGRDDLLRPRDAVPVARERLERVVHGHVPARGDLELLQDRIGDARGEDVAGEQEHGDAVHGRDRGAGEHVRRAGTDRARARERLQAVPHARVPDGGVHHALLVLRLVVRQEASALFQRLAHPGDVAVPEDPPAPGEEALLAAVALDVLAREEAHEGLGHGEPDRGHVSVQYGASNESRMKVATAPISWGACEIPEWGEVLPYARVLDEMSASGYAGTELGPPDYLPRDAKTLARELSARRLAMVGAFCPVPLHDPERRISALRTAAATARLVAELGGSVLVLAAEGDDRRSAIAGRVPADGSASLDERGWYYANALVDRVARNAREHGITTAFHPHAASYVEAPHEIERLLAGTDAALVGLCLDTGHVAYGGANPALLAKDHGGRVKHVHLKDLRRRVHQDAVRRGIDFRDAVGEGVFAPLGDGDLDLRGTLDELRDAGYDGWLVVEQDIRLGITPEAAPLADALRSREFIRQAIGV